MNALPSAIRPRSEFNDRLLLQRVVQGDRQAFEELYVNYHRRLARFLMRLAPRYELAEEIINDTFWIVWQKAGQFRGASQVSTWIMGIAYRRALKLLKTERCHQAAEQLDCLDRELMEDEPAKAKEMQDWIAEGLRELPLEQRMATELAYGMGYSLEEIADIMNCQISTVKARMYHAREKLRHSLPRLAGLHDTDPSEG
jgi:RNA polymerase sigma-70 factor (ECF subfamily)